MKIELSMFIRSLSTALDYVDREIAKTAPNHPQRVAVLTNKMAEYMGMDKETQYDLTHAAVLHDCALLEYVKDESSYGTYIMDESNMSAHCIAGENMLAKLPFYESVKGSILYHHERADGKGALGKTDIETPLTGQLIHIADVMDVSFSLDTIDTKKYEQMKAWAEHQRGASFSDACVDAFLNSVDYELLSSISGDGCKTLINQLLPDRMEDMSTDALREMSALFGTITDYKSHFTWRHSMGIAEKAETMGRYYGYSKEECDRLYISGALHDIGKLMISNDILEKPAKLSADEYKQIQNHAMGTYHMLHGIKGLEGITRWAALHHEKLDGSGYPFGYRAEDLGKNERLMACLDIYQALVEERPYKPGLSHNDAIEILTKMGKAGQLDSTIIVDIDNCFMTDNIQIDGGEINRELKDFTGETWRCPVCGYILEGVLPNEFICPQCEQPGSIFERIDNPTINQS